jgi:hypothetical protein
MWRDRREHTRYSLPINDLITGSTPRGKSRRAQFVMDVSFCRARLKRIAASPDVQ